MNGKNRVLLSLSLWLILQAASCSALPSQYYDDGVSDEEYIHIAGQSKEAQVFLAAFPDAGVYVDREGKLAVDFRHDVVTPAATKQHWQGIRLRMFIDPKDRQVAGAFLDCKDASSQQKFVEEALDEYLQQYVKSQVCP